MDRILRSNKKPKISPLYDSTIDFDESSKLWNENKKKTAGGLYKYVCDKITKKTDKCNRVCYKDTDSCYLHRNTNEKTK